MTRKPPPVTVRPPPMLPAVEPLDASAAAVFVGGTKPPVHQDTSAPAPVVPDAPVSEAPKARKHKAPPVKGRGLVERAGGGAARRVVAYLDPQDAKRLAQRALDEGRDVSSLINEAVRRFLK